jgi:hypothetical protein
MWRTILRPASVIAVVAVLVLAGCGDEDESASVGAQGTPPPSSSPPATATTVGPSTAVTPTSATAPRCANVSFSSDTEDVATDIRSTGLSCTEAEALVRKLGALVSSPTGPSRVESDGFVCTRLSVRSGDHGPPLGTFDCTNAGTKVTFVRALVG